MEFHRLRLACSRPQGQLGDVINIVGDLLAVLGAQAAAQLLPHQRPHQQQPHTGTCCVPARHSSTSGY
jgi:hypothetical protein